jgi:hypothetical protein
MSEDGLMRWTTMAAAGAAIGAALLVTAGAATAAQTSGAQSSAAQSSAAQSTTPPATSQTCYAFAVSALRNHVVVASRPAACAGVSQMLVNEDVSRAIRTVVGPHTKVRGRRLADIASQYLAGLVHPAPPPPSVAVPAGTPSSESQPAIRLAALAAWLAAAGAGGYLLTGWLTRDGRRRVIRKPGISSGLPLAHATLAIAGLGIWIAFMATSTAALAFTDVGLTWGIAGLGMATLLTSGPEQRGSTTEADELAPKAGMSTAAPLQAQVQAQQGGSSTQTAVLAEAQGMSTTPFPSKAPVLVIALHGVLAVTTILLVLLAAVGVG